MTRQSIEDILLHPDCIDPEFSQALGLATWQNAAGELLVAAVDAATGAFLEPRVLDSGLAPLDVTLQGPEFMRHRGLDVIAYTKLIDGMPQVCIVPVTGGTPVQGTFLSSGCTLLSGSQGAGIGRLCVLVPGWIGGSTYWIDTATGIVTPVDAFKGISPPVWLSGTHLLYGSTDGQIACLDTAKGIKTAITDTAGGNLGAYSWLAPERDHRRVYLSVSNDQQRLRVYGPGGLTAPLLAELTAPDGPHTFIGSVEPFICQGRSYASLVLQDAAVKGTEGSVWVWSLFSEPQIRLRVDTRAGVLPLDPETYVAGDLVHVYYSVYRNIETAIEAELWRTSWRQEVNRR